MSLSSLLLLKVTYFIELLMRSLDAGTEGMQWFFGVHVVCWLVVNGCNREQEGRLRVVHPSCVSGYLCEYPLWYSAKGRRV